MKIPCRAQLLPIWLIFWSSGALLAQEPPPAPPGQQLSSEARVEQWRTVRPDEPMPAAFGFGRAVPDQQVEQFVERYGLQLYAIHMGVGGFVGVHRVSAERAGAISVAEARDITVQLAVGSARARQERATRFLAPSPLDTVPSPWHDRGRALLAALEWDQAWAQSARAPAQPIIFGIEVVGPIDGVTAASGDPMVAQFEPGVEVTHAVIVPRLEIPPTLRPRPTPPEAVGLSNEQVMGRIREFAATPTEPRQR